MRRIFLFILLLCSFSLFAAIVPYSDTIGRIQVDIEEESNAEMVLKAFSEEFTEAWIEKYANNDQLFALAYSPILSTLLPMTNLIISEERDNTLSLYSLDSKDFVSVIVSNIQASLENRAIVALSVRRSKPQADQED